MRPERWRQVDAIFQAALERAPGDRAAFLGEVCDGDLDLRHEVEALLASDQEADSFIEVPAVQMAAPLLVERHPGSLVGQSVGHYQVISLLGRGGMGEVYAARDTRLGRQVALKFLPVDLAADPDRMRRFEHEAKAASALNHPNVATIYEIGVAEGRRFIAMEYVAGDTLAARIGGHPLELAEVREVGLQIAEALDEAHGKGITHRDINPANVMLTPGGRVKVLDFGLAKVSRSAGQAMNREPGMSAATTPGLVMGTAGYMSPEQARGQAVDHRSDIFSFGAVLYEMATGHAAFKGRSQVETMNAVINEPHRPVVELNKKVPPQLATLIDRALAKEAGDRYQSMTELLSELRRVAQPLGIRGQGVPYLRSRHSFASRLSPASHRTRLLALVVSLAVVAAIVYSIILLTERLNTIRQPPSRPLARLTFDAGLQSEPAWSPDGRFIAYSSDKSKNFDIWVQPVGGGDPVQVTKSPAHDWQPDWSPDGNQLVFRSEREVGGLFVVPALGGRERKVSPFGYHPRWSPAGTKILFTDAWAGNFSAKVYAVSLDGNAPQEVQAEFLRDFVQVRSADWHPDGQRISLWGEARKSGWGFWTMPLAGGTPLKSGPSDWTAFPGIEYVRWAPSGQAVYFKGISRGVRNLWKVTVDPQTLRWVGGPERLTTGFNDTDLALSPDGKRLAFTIRNESTRAWSLPFDARVGRLKGEAQPVTATGINPEVLNLSHDGTHLLYVASRPGTNKRELLEKSLDDNRETLLAESQFILTPCWSRDGTRIAYSGLRSGYSGRDARALFVLPAGGGDEQIVATGADELLWDWSADGRWLLVGSDRDSPRRWGVLARYPLAAAPHAEAQRRVITSHPEYSLFEARFSPDDRWVVFQATKAGDNATVYVVPPSGGEWTRITEDNVWSDKPRWSPDGKTIYYKSNRVTRFFNVWGIRFDPVRGKPLGEPFRVTSFDSPGRMMLPQPQNLIALSADRLVLPITEVTGSIWVLDNVDR